MSNIDKNSNFMPAAENKMQFRVIDYDNDGHRNDKDLYSNTTSHAGSAIQIGIMDAGNMNKDVERDREIDMAELNALLGNWDVSKQTVAPSILDYNNTDKLYPFWTC